MSNETMVHVRRQYDDWNGADVRLDQVSRLHWSDTSGGVNAKANRSYIHGYVWCTDAKGISHSCTHGPPPHLVKVCLVKSQNKAAWPKIIERLNADSAVSAT
jgi:hypothetical protein